MKSKKVLFLLFVLAFSIRLFFFPFADNRPGDPWERVFTALEWLKHPHIILSGDWLPLHTYLLAGILSIWKDPLIAPRALSLLFGSLTLIPFYLLLRDLFDRNNAILSSILFSFFGLHISYSSQSWSETTGIFFLITGFYLFFTKNKMEPWFSILSGVSLGLSCMVRIEFWPFVPLLIFVRVIQSGFRQSLLFAISSCIFPILWMMSNYIQIEDFLPYYTVNISFERYKIGSFWERLFIYPIRFLKLVGPIIAIGSMGGILISIFKRERYELALPLLVQFIFFIYESVKVNANPQYRFLMVICMLSFPYFFLLIKESSSVLSRKLKNMILILGIASFLSISFWSLLASGGEIRVHQPPVWELELAKKIKEDSGNGNVFFDNYKWFISNLAVRSEITPNRLARVFIQPPYKGIKTPIDFYYLKEDGLFEYFKREKPTYFLYYPGGLLKEYLMLGKKNTDILQLNCSFLYLYEIGPYYVYRIKYFSNQF